MIGLLCSDKKEEAFVKALSGTLKPKLEKANEEALIFTLPNVNLEDRSVHGTLIKGFNLTAADCSLPPQIYNLSQQYKYAAIKKMRTLAEVKDVTLYNPVNRYNQWAISDMLLADKRAGRYVLPAETAEKSDLFFAKGKNNLSHAPPAFIFKPEYSTARSKLIYGRTASNNYEIFDPLPHLCELQELQGKISALAQQGSWLICSAPELFVYGNMLFTARIWAQKEADGRWSILQQTCTGNLNSLLNAVEHQLRAAVDAITECIHCFIPAIFICFIDLAFDLNGNPKFLGFGGWQDYLITQLANPWIKEAICHNIVFYASNDSRK